MRPDWTLEIQGLSGVRRFLPTRVPAGWSVAEIRLGVASVLDTPIDFSGSSRVVDALEVVLTDRVATTRGMVRSRNGSNVGGLRVAAFSTDRSRWYDRSRFVTSTVTTNDGAFSFTSLPTDTYYVAIVPSSLDDPNAWRDPSALDELAWRASTVSVQEGTTVTIELESRP
ncbi:MAG: carboxypeptidase-like regulatory domain-containing protein [Vicinamibacterales bacterium]